MAYAIESSRSSNFENSARSALVLFSIPLPRVERVYTCSRKSVRSAFFELQNIRQAPLSINRAQISMTGDYALAPGGDGPLSGV